MAPTTRLHSSVSPSSLSRALRCPGSVNFIEDMAVKDDAGAAADEGTILHSFCEDCLKNDLNPYDLVGEQRSYNGLSYELTDDDADGIMSGIDILDEQPGKLFVEKRVYLDRWMPGQSGTSDAFIVGKRRVVVFDWKWGFLPVSPVENEQLMAYALGVWDNYAEARIDPDVDVTFRLIIHQPRAPGGGGEWDVSLDDLLEYGKRLKKLNKQVCDPDAPRVAGEKQCLYCPGAKLGTCPEYEKFNADLILRSFEELDEEIELGLPMRLPRLITPERRSHILMHRGMVTKWLDRLHAETLDDALKGRPTPGLKAVEGRRPPRKWTDKEDAEKALLQVLPASEVYTRRVITPTQAEKLVVDEDFSPIARKLIAKTERKPVLVPVQDARPAKRTTAEEFEED